MNIALAIIGAILIIVAGIMGMIHHNNDIESGKIPKHGARRVVLGEGKYWIESYSAFPGWSRRDVFDTLEEAKNNKVLWDRITDSRDRKPEVIVE